MRDAWRFRLLAPLAAATVAAVALVSSTSATLAAWTDDEYVSAGAGVMVAGDCTTTTLFQTESSSRQLSGSLGAADLDSLAGIQGIQLRNTSGTLTAAPATAKQVDPVTYTSALQAGALDALSLSAVVGLNQPAGNAGAYTQWARARASGQAAGAAGLVSDQSGAIDGTGTAAGSTSAPNAASINLASVIPSSTAAMTLDVGALASSAAVDACTLTNGWPTLDPSPTVARDYGIAGLRLNLSADSIQPMTAQVSQTLGAVDQQLSGLEAPSGSIATAISAGVSALVAQAGTELRVGAATTTITFGTPDLSAANALLSTTRSDGVVTVDLANARISFDLAEFAELADPGDGSGGLNGQGPNTSLDVSAATVQNLTARTAALLNGWGEDVTAEVEKALAATAFTMETTLLLQAGGILEPVDVAEVTLRYATTLGAFLAPAPLSPLPEPTVSTRVLGLGLPEVDLLGSVTDALLGGTGAVVAKALKDTLFGTGGLLPATAAAVQSAVDPVTDEARAALAPLADTLALTVNVQPDQPGAPASPASAGSSADGQYKVSALRIGVAASTTEIYLATSSAGPVVFRPGTG